MDRRRRKIIEAFDIRYLPEEKPSEKTDVYMLGLTLYELIEGRRDLPPRFMRTPEWMRGLILKMLNKDPGMRPGIKEVMEKTKE